MKARMQLARYCGWTLLAVCMIPAVAFCAGLAILIFNADFSGLMFGFDARGPWGLAWLPVSTLAVVLIGFAAKWLLDYARSLRCCYRLSRSIARFYDGDRMLSDVKTYVSCLPDKQASDILGHARMLVDRMELCTLNWQRLDRCFSKSKQSRLVCGLQLAEANAVNDDADEFWTQLDRLTGDVLESRLEDLRRSVDLCASSMPAKAKVCAQNKIDNLSRHIGHDGQWDRIDMIASVEKLEADFRNASIIV